MDLRRTLTLASKSLNEAVIEHALIGGFALAAYGINRRSREFRDKADIQELLTRNFDLNFDLIKEYADLFDEWPTILKMRSNP